MSLTVTSDEGVFFCNTPKRQEFSAEDLSRWTIIQGFAHKLLLLRMSIPNKEFFVNGALTEDAKEVLSFLKEKLWRNIPYLEHQSIEQRFVQAP